MLSAGALSFPTSSELRGYIDDYQVCDDEVSSERVDMDVNVIFLSDDYTFIGDDERVA